MYFDFILAPFILFLAPGIIAMLLYKDCSKIKLLSCFLASYFLSWLGFLVVYFTVSRKPEKE